MGYPGRVRNGVVVLDEPHALPEGTEVEVIPVAPGRDNEGTTSLESVAGAAQGLPADLSRRHNEYRRERQR